MKEDCMDNGGVQYGVNRLLADDDGNAYLKRDGRIMVCPFQFEVLRCGTWCPHFNLNQVHDGSMSLLMTCGSRALSYKIER
jgi:hypothetical protein